MNTFAIFSIFFATTLVACFADSSLETVVHQSSCSKRCTFRACKITGIKDDLRPRGTTVLIRDQRIASNPFVCLPGSDLGRIITTGEALVATVRGGSFQPISAYKPDGLSPRYPKNYFGLTQISFPPLPGKFGLSHVPSRGNQFEKADNLCVVVPIEKYEVNVDGRTRTRTATKPTDCVSYRVRAPKVLIELTWDSADDFDLVVTEPGEDGFKISRSDTRAPSGGRLINDNAVGACGLASVGREQVRYLQDDNPPRGEYVVQGMQFQNCGNGPTNWNVAIVVDGVKVEGARGKSNFNNSGRNVFEIKFTL